MDKDNQNSKKEENFFELVRDNFGNLLIIKEINKIQQEIINQVDKSEIFEENKKIGKK